MKKQKFLTVIITLIMAVSAIGVQTTAFANGVDGSTVDGTTNTTDSEGTFNNDDSDAPDEEESTTHTHTYGDINLAKKPKCTEAGNKAYCKCEIENCNTYFIVETNDDGNNIYTEVIDTTDDNDDEIPDVIVIPATGHNMTPHVKVEATCTTDGNIEYWYCETEQKYFSDENGDNEIAVENTVIPATGHIYVDGKCSECGAVDPDHVCQGGTATCKNKAVCEICKKEYGCFAEHQYVIDEATAPTCTDTGLKAGFHCSECEKVFIKQEEIPATGHNMTYHTRVEATCTNDGNIEYWYCSGCNKYFSDEEGKAEIVDINKDKEINIDDTVITSAGHKYVNGVCTICGFEDPTAKPTTSEPTTKATEAPAVTKTPTTTKSTTKKSKVTHTLKKESVKTVKLTKKKKITIKINRKTGCNYLIKVFNNKNNKDFTKKCKLENKINTSKVLKKQSAKMKKGKYRIEIYQLKFNKSHTELKKINCIYLGYATVK